MQTFLPYKDFRKSAESLDKKRCWKQVVEAKQIISVLEGKTTAWQNHPAVKMWVGHLPELMLYYNAFLNCCIQHHKINTKLEVYPLAAFVGKREIEDGGVFINNPWWLGQEQFHRSHRARLIEKDKEFYLPKFPSDLLYNNGKYWWPVMETKTFKTI